ncbi:hypothetical protein D3C75_1355270 [compost metagenome]
MLSMATFSFFVKMSIPIFSAPKAVKRCVRIKFARLKRLSGERTNNGRPLSMPVMFSPE